MSIDYARMTTPQRWEWHANLYAFRRVVLGIAQDIRTSPCDTQGVWFDEHAVAQAEAELRAKLAEQSRRCAASTAADNAIVFADAERWRATRAAPTPRAAE